MVGFSHFLFIYVVLALVWFWFFVEFPANGWTDPVWDVGLLALFTGSGAVWWRISRG